MRGGGIAVGGGGQASRPLEKGGGKWGSGGEAVGGGEQSSRRGPGLQKVFFGPSGLSMI